MRVFDFHLAVTAANEVRDQIHRPRTIQRHQRGDVLDRSELKLTAKITHAAGFQLEHTHRVTIVQQVIRLLITQRQPIHVEIDPMPLLHHLAGVADHGERFEPEKIHLQQAKILNGAHWILGRDRTVVVFFERQDVHQWLSADHNPCRMNGGVPGQIFQNKCCVD